MYILVRHIQSISLLRHSLVRIFDILFVFLQFFFLLLALLLSDLLGCSLKVLHSRVGCAKEQGDILLGELLLPFPLGVQPGLVGCVQLLALLLCTYLK